MARFYHDLTMSTKARQKKNLESDCELKFGYFQWCNKGVDFYQ